MSSFECSKYHKMETGETVCRICGGRVRYMDGMNSQQLEDLDRRADRRIEEEEEE